MLANAPGGTNGVNVLTSCAGVVNNGTVLPPDATAADNSGVCAPSQPTALFTDCRQFGIVFDHVD